MQYDVIVIGSGVGGLVSALKLSQQGRRVLLLEKHPVPGGLATNFKRSGFTFEAAIHCVDGLAEKGVIRNYLEGFDLTQHLDFIRIEEFAKIIYPGHSFIADFNQNNFIAFLKKEFPQEDKNIDAIFKRFKLFFKQFDRYCESSLPDWLNLALSPFLYLEIIKASTCTIEQLLDNYTKNKKLQSLICEIWKFIGLPLNKLSALYFLAVYKGYYYDGPTAYIKGGFLGLFKAMVKKIEENGGEVKFNATVKRIITHKGCIRGVATEKEEYKTKVVISNANPLHTLGELIDNAKLSQEYQAKLAPLEKSISASQLYLGLKVPAKTLGMHHHIISVNSSYSQEQDFSYSLSSDYENCSFMLVDHTQIDPSLAPVGKGTLMIMVLDNYSHWKDLNQEDYKRQKREVALKLIQRAEKYLPGLSNNIEIMELATPKTMQRFGNSLEGAIYGYAQTVLQSSINRLRQETKIKGLFLTGAWTQPGHGIHGCFISGVTAADLALKRLPNS